MSKVTNYQRMIRSGQPYTLVNAVRSPKVDATPEGPQMYLVTEYQIVGFTYEHKFFDEEWHLVWESHDVGREPTLEAANNKAREWRTALVGQYECR